MDKRFAEPYSNPRWWWWEGNHTPHCFHCSHFRGRSKSKGGAVWCLAFPDGIPDDLLVRKDAKHDVPYPGDNGIQFEPYKENNEGAEENQAGR